MVVISAPSGCGKTTIVRELLKRNRRSCAYSLSDTTRMPRQGERQGRDYHFVSERQFVRGIRNGRYLEWARVFGSYYGTPRMPVAAQQKKRKNVILDIDVAGAQQIMKTMPEAVFIFVLPPSKKELIRRLVKRNKNTAHDMKQRLAAASREMKTAYRYEYVVVNERVTESVIAIEKIIHAERYRVKRNKEVIHALHTA